MLLDLNKNSGWIDVDCSADLKHCLVFWYFLSRDVGKRLRKGGQARGDGSNSFSFNALFFTWQVGTWEKEKEGRTRWKRWQQCFFYALFFTWQARGKRGRKGGQAEKEFLL